MRKKITLMLAILCLLSFKNVNAESLCSYEEQANLNKEVANIKFSYEAKEKEGEAYSSPETGETVIPIYHYLEVSSLNLNDKFYIIVSNDKDANEFTLSGNADNVASFDWENIYDGVTKLKFEIYSTDKTSCPNEKYRTEYLTLPYRNLFSDYLLCQDNDASVCQEYLTGEKITEEQLYEAIYNTDDESKTEKPKEKAKKENVYDNKYFWITCGGAAAVLVIIAVIIVIRKKNEK